MPPAEQVLAFLRTLPIVAGLKAGETIELLEFQEQFVRGIYSDVDDLGRRRIRIRQHKQGVRRRNRPFGRQNSAA